jgi:serine/threonine protein kinase
MQNFIGQKIDRYRITERLGMGGMAVVYKAYDTRLERDVAIKIIRTEAIPAEQHNLITKRFEREARSQAKLAHPNIVQVFSSGEINEHPYLVMTYLDGGTLKEKIGQPYEFQKAIDWLLPIAQALSYAHMLGIIHRDVKPSNILFDSMGNPVLADFGIAKIIENSEMTLTGTGLGVGTPEYMAPEQWVGDAVPASDQYALGTVLYELLTGQKPYTADTPVAVAVKQLTEPLILPGRIISGIPKQVEKLIEYLLAPEVNHRYQSMQEVCESLEDVLSGKDPKEPVQLTKMGNPQDVSTQSNDQVLMQSEAITLDGLNSEHRLDTKDNVKNSEENEPLKPKIAAKIIKFRWILIPGMLIIIAIFVFNNLFQGNRDNLNVNEQTPVSALAVNDTPSLNAETEIELVTTSTQEKSIGSTTTPTLTPTLEPTPTKTTEEVIPELGLKYPINYIFGDTIKRYNPDTKENSHIMDIVPSDNPHERSPKTKWSSDGRFLLYGPLSSVENYGRNDLYDKGLFVYDTQEMKEMIVSDRLSKYQLLEWSPNNEYVLFASSMEGMPGLYVFDTKQSAYQLIKLFNSTRNVSVHWSDDSGFVYFLNPDNGEWFSYNIQSAELLSAPGHVMEYPTQESFPIYYDYEYVFITNLFQMSIENEEHQISFDQRGCLIIQGKTDAVVEESICLNEQITSVGFSKDQDGLLISGYRLLYYVDLSDKELYTIELDPGYLSVCEYVP